jgi:D-alanine transaminase
VRGVYAGVVLAYVNGELCAPEAARVSPFDRGYLFADGVYEALRVTMAGAGAGGDPRVVAPHRHVRRLARSLGALSIPWPAGEMLTVARQLIEGSRLSEALIYFQVTRGVPGLAGRAPQALRTHVPPAGLTPTVFAFIRPMPRLDTAELAPPTKRCATGADMRWLRCDIKSIALLGNVLASVQAAGAGAEEAILLRSTPLGRVASEGSLTNLAVVRADGVLMTPALESASILPGITREILLDNNTDLAEGVVTEADLRAAREVMLLGTTAAVTAVTHLDGAPVHDGGAGPITRRLHAGLMELVARAREDI